MRVLTVATLFSPDGAFGGPIRVAVNQAKVLRSQGHEVAIAGGVRGFHPIPEAIEGIPAKLFPVRKLVPVHGYAGLVAPGLVRWVASTANEWDIVHLHLGRDLVTMLPARIISRTGVPFVVQTHGMIQPRSDLLATWFDRILTRPVLRKARAVLYLNANEADQISVVARSDVTLRHLWNGVPALEKSGISKTSSAVEVLFLARLHKRKRPLAFVEAAAILAPEFPQVEFRLVGPDEGEAVRVAKRSRELGPGVKVEWEGPVAPEDVSDRLARADIYVLPTIDEAFGMSVAEAMIQQIPVVVTDTCGLAPFVKMAGAGVIVDGSTLGLADGIRFLLENPEVGKSMGLAGRRAAIDSLSIDSVAEELLNVYRECVD